MIHGSVDIEDGVIRAFDEGTSSNPAAIDLEGDYLLPGLIEMHTDNMEKNLEPRPGVKWPSPMAAVLAHDAQIAAAGITTVLDAISIGEAHKAGRDTLIADSIAGVERGLKEDVLRADHMLHLRCEVVGASVLDLSRPPLRQSAGSGGLADGSHPRPGANGARSATGCSTTRPSTCPPPKSKRASTNCVKTAPGTARCIAARSSRWRASTT